ncbi:MAG: hypothetical protein L0Y72_13265 [Gemmataceae bacterium]|nr:hypothetical protein [Gemmataceae bacterium]MCI0740008.1 hypothetical protein [Gemmataceae bacterium]
MARSLGGFLLMLGTLSGCLPLFDESAPTKLVGGNPFEAHSTAASAPNKGKFAPAAQEIALRVDAVGRKVLAANPQIGMRPLFATIGSPQAEIFHMDTRLVYVTEGLVKKCKTEGELGALLSLELAKMVADREARSPLAQDQERLTPIHMAAGNAARGMPGDQTALVELAKYEKANPKKDHAAPRPDPHRLARGYLEKSGFTAADLEAVAPLLHAAEQNNSLERTLKGGVPQSNWSTP